MTDPSPDPPVVDAAELTARLGGSREVLAQLLPVLVQSVTEWQTALTAAIAANDADQLRRTAHQAKGALLTFAARRAAAAAQSLEDLGKSGNLAEAPAALALLMAEVALAQEAVRGLAG